MYYVLHQLEDLDGNVKLSGLLLQLLTAKFNTSGLFTCCPRCPSGCFARFVLSALTISFPFCTPAEQFSLKRVSKRYEKNKARKIKYKNNIYGIFSISACSNGQRKVSAWLKLVKVQLAKLRSVDLKSVGLDWKLQTEKNQGLRLQIAEPFSKSCAGIGL